LELVAWSIVLGLCQELSERMKMFYRFGFLTAKLEGRKRGEERRGEERRGEERRGEERRGEERRGERGGEGRGKEGRRENEKPVEPIECCARRNHPNSSSTKSSLCR
jgi:hypothetical protein